LLHNIDINKFILREPQKTMLKHPAGTAQLTLPAPNVALPTDQGTSSCHIHQVDAFCTRLNTIT
jgi:hypothetical protein